MAAQAARWSALAVEVALLAVIAAFAARLVWLVVYGASASNLDIAPPDRSLPEIRQSADLSALQSGRLFASPDRPAVMADEIAPETALDLTLFGVRRGPDPQSGSAVIRTGNIEQRSYAVGATILDGVTLEAVYPDRVTIRRRGLAESLYLREEARRNSSLPAASVSDDGSAAAEFWSAIQIVPVFRDGALAGYRLTETSRADLLSRTGLQAGDLITAVNGIRFASGTDIGRVINEVGSADRLRLEVERGGSTQTIDVEPR
ncbi:MULTISPECIES: type II secretion system protein N [Hyphobacterium]|uniref:Type II secretion system protein N n=1 Tax=Hyphobacterium vulgare TaxID=1736751 RepID=A0ABV6ZVA4_9PROT